MALVAGTVILAAVVAVVQDSVTHSVLRGLMVLVAVPCAAIDLQRRIIPNRITGSGAVLALAAGLALAAALIASLLTGVAIASRRGVHAVRKTALPFGPYLTVGGLLAAPADRGSDLRS